MKVRQSGFDISQRDVESILILCSVAKANGAVLTLKELVMLTTINATEEQLERVWVNNYALNSAYSVNSGFITERNPKVSYDYENRINYIQDKSRAETNIRKARRFASLISSPGVRLVSVSGSTSYQVAHSDDDVDFFCVTRKNEMWMFMLKTLLLARINRLAHKEEPPVCFSCVMDEERASEEFGRAQDPLFARDALTARTIHGLEYFQELLTKAPWMKNFYPKLYQSKLNEKVSPPSENDSRSSVIKRIINSYLFHVIGGYIRIKSNLLNRRLTKARKSSSIFSVRLGEDHCIYESVRYRRLRETYSRLPKRSSA